jgi:F-type H+-transporting ATPase subunit gamma
MQTVESLKRQIRTAQDLASVVRTTKTLAAVNIRQYDAAAEALGNYQQTIEQLVRMLIWNDPTMLVEAAGARAKRFGLIAFGSDQGMCGGFNEAIHQAVGESIDRVHSQGAHVRIVVLGRRLADRLSDFGHQVDHCFDLPGSVSGMTPVLNDVLLWIDAWRTQHQLEIMMVCHNRRRERTNYEPVRTQLLPVSPKQFVPDPPRRWSGRSLPQVTMPSEQLWQSIVRQFLFVSLFEACAESQASENAARISAMQAAEVHIRDRLDDFQLDYQQLRQRAITEELLDVITGFEALTRTEG